MKFFLFLVGIFFLGITTYAQEFIQINTDAIVKTVPPERVGINVNYLTDDSPNTIKALQKLGVKFLRFPGGEKSDNYIWGQRPFTQANHTLALTGSCHWPNNDNRFSQPDFKNLRANILNFDEFMVLAQKTKAIPLIVVNGDGHHNTGSTCGGVPPKDSLIMVAREWVRYANLVKKHQIKYWMIGNESFKSAAYAGKVTPQQYRDDVIDFARSMKAIDPSIKIIVNGDTDDWWRVVLSDTVATSLIDYLGISAYPIYKWENGYENYRLNQPDFTHSVRTAFQAIEKYVMNPIDRQRIRIMVTETNALDFAGDSAWANTNDLGHALVLFDLIGKHLLAAKVDFTFFWNTRWVNNKIDESGFNALNNSGEMLPKGQVLSLWNSFLLNNLVTTTSTDKVISFASTQEGQLNIFLLNKANQNLQVELQINNFKGRGNFKRYIFSGKSLTDNIPEVSLAKSLRPISKSQYTQLNVPLFPNSITVLQYNPESFSILQLPLEGWALLGILFLVLRQIIIQNRKKLTHKSFPKKKQTLTV